MAAKNARARTSSGIRYFKLFVKDAGRPSVSLLEYLDENINVINDMGIKLKLAKIASKDLDKELIDRLASKGIMRLPALVTDENKIKQGVKKITTLFEDNKISYRQFLAAQRQPQQNNTVYSGNFSDDQQLAAFYQNEMNEDALNRDKASHGDDAFEGSSTRDFDRRVNESLRKRNIVADNPTQNMNIDTEMAARKNAPAKPKKTKLPETDNIAETSGESKFDAMFDSKFMQGAMDDPY